MMMRFALLLCPREFRERYGSEISEAFDRNPSFREINNVLVEGTCMRFDALLLNIVLAFRSLRRSWLPAIVAVAAIAFGVGSNVAGAAILNAAFLHALPVPDAKQVFYATEPAGMTYSDGHALANATGQYGSIALSEPDHKTYVSGGRRIALSGALVDPSYFSVLRLNPMLGTFFTDNPSSSIVLSEKFWRSILGTGSVIGSSIVLGDRTYKVVGIAPAGFHGMPQYDVDAAYWLATSPSQAGIATDASFSAVVRTKDGMDPSIASRAIGKVLEGIAQAHQKNAACCVAVNSAQAAALSKLGPLLMLIYIITWIALIIGCINVANLQLARNFAVASARATRAALGATPRQINAEIVTEAALLSAIGCLLGVALAWGTLRLIAASLPVLGDVRIDIGIIVYALALVVVTTAIIAALPCIAQGRSNIAAMIKGTGQSTSDRGGRRFIGALVFVQVSLTAMLVLTCAAVLNAFGEAQNASNGFSTNNVYVAEIDVSQKFPDAVPMESQEGYVRRTSDALIAAIRNVPGILDVATATQIPFFCCRERNFSVPNGPSDLMVLFSAVSPQYFDALGSQVEIGRSFDVNDDQAHPGVAIVDTLFAQRVYGKSNVLGERLIGRANYRIVGVVPPMRQAYGAPPRPMVYLPMAQFPRLSYIIVRSNGTSDDVGRAIIAATHAVDQSIPEPTVFSYGEVLRMREAPSIAGSWTILVFAIVGFALALSGIYAISAFSSQLRQREFAIRAALGATQRSLLVEAVRRPLIQTLIAVLVGTLLSLVLTNILSAALSVNVRSTLVSVMVAFVVFMMCVILATVAPAFRVLHESPAGLLRTE